MRKPRPKPPPPPFACGKIRARDFDRPRLPEDTVRPMSTPSPAPDSIADIASAGYRAARWLAARRVLANRLAKGRLDAFFAHWMPQSTFDDVPPQALEIALDENGSAHLLGGLAASARERALLHLPALRPFWTQELRAAHFDALRRIVPRAWFLDDTPVPHGAVISGLEIACWADFSRKHDAARFELCDEKKHSQPLDAGKLPAQAAERRFVITQRVFTARVLTARYHRDENDRLTLAECQGMP